MSLVHFKDSIFLKFGTVVKHILSQCNTTKCCGAVPACTGRSWSSGFYDHFANIQMGNRSLAFQENI